MPNIKQIIMIGCMGLILSACSETELASHWWKTWEHPDKDVASTTSQEGNYKIGNPYRAAGQWYTPVESYSYDETGIASWYGDEFHGKRTANGEVFDKNELTAAHPTLQMPSLIRVTNLENGRSAVLRVNDRGPFARSRLIDVSHRAAEVLGFIGKGTARVRVQVLERESRILADAARKGYPPKTQMAMAFQRVPESQTTTTTTQVASADTGVTETQKVITTSEIPAPATDVSKADIEELNKELFRKFPVTPTNIYVQVGSFANSGNAKTLRQKLSPFGHVDIYPSVVNGKTFNRVRVGPLANVPDADKTLSRIISAGYSQARIIVD
jgi:rare lipoprotein A